jgi:hypothetical protein
MRSPHLPYDTHRSNRAAELASALEDFTPARIDVAIFSNVGFHKLGFLAVRKMNGEGPASGFWNIKGKPGVRISLDELAPDRGNLLTEPSIECSLLCQMAVSDLEEADVEGKIQKAVA